jgi:membrane protease YdiL (CAAX protease family)
MSNADDRIARGRADVQQARPTIHSANLLFLICTIVMIVTLTLPSLGWSPHLVSIIPMVLFLLLASLFMRYHRLPFRATLRLRWPGLGTAALSLLIGAGVWLMATWLGHLVDLFFGYSVPWSPDYYPRTPAQVAALFLSWCVAAPLGEEVLFRGVVQRAHERRGPRFGILAVALLFSLYHMSFQSLLALLPLALALGYVVWRSDSLISGILIHFANNVLASARIVTATLRPDLRLGIPSLPAAIVGMIFALVGLWLFRGGTISPSRPPAPEPTPWLRRAWPLLIAVPLFCVLAGMQFVVGRFPQVLAFDRLALQVDGACNAPWKEPARWVYELHAVDSYPYSRDEPVGWARCRLTPEPADGSFALDCQVQRAAFDANKTHTSFEMVDLSLQQTVRWRREDLQLTEGEATQRTGGHRLTMRLARDREHLMLAVRQENGLEKEVTLSHDALLMGEWPWRLSALRFGLGYVRRTTLAWPRAHTERGQGSHPNAEETYLVVRNAEPVWTPSGIFVAWRVTLGDRQSAWYDAEPPHTLVRYEDGSVTYLLADVEQGSSTDG